MRLHLKFAAWLLVLSWFSAAHAGSYEDWFQAIKRDNPGPMRELLARGFDPNALDPQGTHGLYMALRDGSLKAAEVLVDWPQTRIDWRTPQDESPLMMAALKGHTEFVRKLIARDAAVNKPGWAPLHYAATKGDTVILAMLLEEHAFIDAQSPNGTTPLMMAAHYGTEAAVHLLLEEGADPLMKNELGLTAIDFARRADRPAIAEMIAKTIREKQKGRW